MQSNPIQYEDTFTQTIIINISVVIIVLIAFGMLKQLLPSVYMPLKSSTTNKWFFQTLNMDNSQFLQRGNLAALFVIFQKLIIDLLFQIVMVLSILLFPVYFLGSNQTIVQLSIWSKLQITSLEDQSSDIIIPLITCMIVSFLGCMFYKNFNYVYIQFKQIIMKRSTPQNYVLLFEGLPVELQDKQNLEYALNTCFPKNQVVKVIPISPKSQILQYYFYQLKLFVKGARTSDDNLAQFQNKLFLLQNTYKQGILNDIKIKQIQHKFNKQVELKQKENVKISYYKIQINKIINEMQLIPNYINSIQHACPDYPSPAQVRLLDKNKTQLQNNQKLTQKDDLIPSLIGKSCFVIFKSQTEASLANNIALFADNTAPYVQQSCHPDQILWYNIASSKSSQICSYALFWVLITALFIGYFVPQAYLLQLASQYQQQIFNLFFNNICISILHCDNFDLTEKFKQPRCFMCYELNTLIVTYMPQLISAIFMSCLPQIITLLLFIPKFKSRAQRNNLKFVCLFAFLGLIQGVLHIILGAALNDQGVLNFKQLLELSIFEIFNKISQNISQSSFIFSNYVMTKYFLLGVFTLLRIPDVFLVFYKKIYRRSSQHRIRTYKFFEFSFPTQLAYICHMVVVGMMYSIVSPISIVMVFIGIISISLTTRYNIYYINPQYSTSDLSGEVDIMKLVITTCYYSFYLMIITCFAYYFSLNRTWITLSSMIILVILLIIMICYKLNLDRKFKKSISSKTLGSNSINLLSTPTSRKFQIQNVSYIMKTSILHNDYITSVVSQDKVIEYELDRCDINNISCMYTHPAIILTTLYPNEEDNELIL
ncbi:putative phosphate transporter [Spironucleus salmonicida]|uniref:Phosphate transporter n=1 Tax=Spironucleus salmonicida TaxID=348837 RepID=V6LRQ2_9EUKA|nr:putative phosphate transporter [Spironucleus salmonicida]|eukprot:EST47245.1 Transmembrane domain-containing protein [Spironucleus salmonicida]